MAGVNKVILVGNLGKDPEVRHLESGVAVASFTIATSETYKDRNSGEKKTLTEWHNIVLWRGLADIAEKYLHKGDQIYIEGRLRSRSWEGESGTRYITEEALIRNQFLQPLLLLKRPKRPQKYLLQYRMMKRMIYHSDFYSFPKQVTLIIRSV